MNYFPRTFSFLKKCTAPDWAEPSRAAGRPARVVLLAHGSRRRRSPSPARPRRLAPSPKRPEPPLFIPPHPPSSHLIPPPPALPRRRRRSTGAAAAAICRPSHLPPEHPAPRALAAPSRGSPAGVPPRRGTSPPVRLPVFFKKNHSFKKTLDRFFSVLLFCERSPNRSF